jgi:GNAT superfamily N-acetyltransferase
MCGETESGGLTATFRALDPHDDRRAFDCGRDSINRWFREQAGQAARKGTAATTVGLDNGTGRIASFYALVAHRLELEGLPADATGPRRGYPMPAILIAQLGVDVTSQGRGVGRATLLDALARLAVVSVGVGFEAVIVGAIDDRAAAFYAAHGFHPLTSDLRRLALPARELRRALPHACLDGG